MSAEIEETSNGFWAKLTRSLSFRLLILFFLFAVGILLAIRFAIGVALDSQFKENIRPHVAQYLSYIRKDIGEPPSIERAKLLTETLPIDIAIVFDNERWTSLESPIDFELLKFHRHKRRHDLAVEMARHDNRFILKTLAQNHQLYLILPERPRFRESILAISLTVGLIVLLIYICYRIIRWLFRPVTDIQVGVANYSRGDFDHQIPVRRNDDLGVLVGRINNMGSDIKNMLDAKRQLMLGVSHELRSPVTRAKVNVALLPDSIYKEAIDNDLSEMEAMVNELLESERLNTSHRTLDLVSTDLLKLIHDVVDEGFAEEKVFIESQVDSPKLMLDIKRIKLLLRNLIANAIRYSQASERPPKILLSATANELVMSVVDYGKGISEEHIVHLTEPFYRTDSARARHTGGYGLGLYLCRLIAEAHSGELKIKSQEGVGTTVSLYFPKAGAI